MVYKLFDVLVGVDRRWLLSVFGLTE